MTARIHDLSEERDRRRTADFVLPWVAFASVCFWPASLALSAAFCAFDALCAWDFDRWR